MFPYANVCKYSELGKPATVFQETSIYFFTGVSLLWPCAGKLYHKDTFYWSVFNRSINLLKFTGLPHPPTGISVLHFQTHLSCVTKYEGVKCKQWIKSTMLNVQITCNIHTHLEDSATETKLTAVPHGNLNSLGTDTSYLVVAAVHRS